MHQLYLKIVVLFLFIFNITASFSQTIKLSNNAEISVINCDSGEQLYSLFGHTAIRIQDPNNYIDAVYNYGYFDFRTPNFYLKFVKGNLQYFVAVDQYKNFLPEYIYDQRGVYEQKLNLTDIEKQKIFDNLNEVIASENRFYTYKFIDRNCTTMVVDIINKNINGTISTKINDQKKSYRTILYGYLKNHFYENLGINIMFGLKTDEKFNHIYLPMQLLEGIKISANNGHSLSNNVKVVNIKSATKNTGSLWNNWFSYAMFLVIVVAINKRNIYLTYFTIVGILGIFLLVVGLISLHKELSLNINVLLFNPLMLFLVYFDLKNNRKLIRIFVNINLIFLVAYTIFMVNKVHLLMFLPLILTNYIFFIRILLKNKTA